MKIAILATIAIIASFTFIPHPADKLVFLDVGQGDAILIQQGSRQILIDGGQGTAVLERLAQEMPWFDQTIETIILTHPDRDHLEGIVHVLKRYRVGMVLLPQSAGKTQLQAEALRIIREQNIPYRFGWHGQRLTAGEITLSILGPQDSALARQITRQKINNSSIITRVDFRGLSFLLTGDAERAAERLLVGRANPALLDADILKTGHHGSKTSTTPALLAAASPRALVTSVGADNTFGHPHPDVLARIAGYTHLRTDQHGSVRFLSTPAGWQVQCTGEERLLFWKNSCI